MPIFLLVAAAAIYRTRSRSGLVGFVFHQGVTILAPGCGMGPILMEDVREKVEIIPTVDNADVELVFDPPWNQSMMSEEARLQVGLF